jgi:hypothetical protein
MKINQIELIVLGCLLLGLVLLGSMGFLSSAAAPIEHFGTITTQVPECPIGYTFFNDKAGTSLCCNGTVDPYKHTCSGKGQNDLCAFVDNMSDPRSPKNYLPQCARVFETQYQQESTAKCPNKLPNYANDRKGNTKCCRSMASDNGKRCSHADMNDPKNYCIVDGPVGPNEQKCDTVSLFESANSGCPSGFNVTPITLGAREESAYGTSAKGLSVPACVNMTDTCIPDTVIRQLQATGVYRGKDPATWSKSCSVWKKINVDRDTTFTPVTAYP